MRFGVMITANVQVGTITPPVGLYRCIAGGITKAHQTATSEAVTPRPDTMFAFPPRVTYIPCIPTFLPRAPGMMRGIARP